MPEREHITISQFTTPTASQLDQQILGSTTPSIMDIDPITGKPIPKEAIQRVLHISQKVHLYRIPPITSTKGFAAASWTSNPADQIFTARMRVIETAVPSPSGGEEKVTATILLEDPKNGQLFAAAPYDKPAVVEQASDSSRFFAIRVAGAGGMKATLGLGFEERTDAFEFSVALQDVRRTLGLEGGGVPAQGMQRGMRPAVPGRNAPAGGAAAAQVQPKSDFKRDFSLKEGETITINIGGRSGKDAATGDGGGEAAGGLFSIPPPPGSKSSGAGAGTVPFLPPPPSAASVKAGQGKKAAEDFGFDDGEFGEFQ